MYATNFSGHGPTNPGRAEHREGNDEIDVEIEIDAQIDIEEALDILKKEGFVVWKP